jgi:DNA-binding IclR family transcriptional regulator
MASRVGLPKATVHRLAGELVANGFLDHRDDGRYSLGLKLSELGALARSELDVVHACAPAMDALVDWEALELTTVATRVSPHTLSVVPITGQRQVIPPGAPGKALLLGLPSEEADRVLRRLPLPALTTKSHTDRAELLQEIADARSVGFAVAEGEYVDGVSGVAVPVMFEGTHPRATIGVVGPTLRMAGQLEQIGELALELTATLRPTPTLEVA